jgi:hypothetical protein
MSRGVRWIGPAAAAAALELLSGAEDASASSARLTQACTPSTNVEAIIDDSGSMLETDQAKFRVTCMEQFIGLAGNNGRTLGAIEFGSLADTVFAPTQIRGSLARRTMVGALRAKIAGDGAFGSTASGVDDGFGTDYNDSFARAATDFPSATARIFLTDGAHNENEYTNGHRGGPRTFVIGLSLGADPSSPDAARLQQIATETGGQYFANLKGVGLQAIFNEITQALSCSAPPQTIAVPTFTSTRQRVTRAFKPALRAKRATFVVNWEGTGNRFRFSGVKAIGKRGKVLATLTGKGKPQKLKVSGERADTFQTLTIRRVTGLRRYRITVAATRLFGPEAPVVQASNVK